MGEAILDYLQHGRPKTSEHSIFFRTLAPEPMTCNGVSGRASHYLHKAGIPVSCPGSHTLRHTCVQRLVVADFSSKPSGTTSAIKALPRPRLCQGGSGSPPRGWLGHRGGSSMKPRWNGFHSPLANGIQQFLAHKRALGQNFCTEEKRRCACSMRFWSSRKCKTLARSPRHWLMRSWLPFPGTRPRSYNHLISVLRRLFHWLVVNAYLPSFPWQMPTRRETSPRIPFLFTPDQGRKLLACASSLEDNSRAPCGVRPIGRSFALALWVGG